MNPFPMSPQTRREFVRHTFKLSALAAVGSFGLGVGRLQSATPAKADRYTISLHPYSLKPLFDAGTITLETYPAFVREHLNFDNLEFDVGDCAALYENPRLGEFHRRRARDLGIRIQTLLGGAEPALDADSDAERRQAIEQHVRWVEVAERLGCDFIRLRAATPGNPEERLEKASETLGALANRVSGSPVRLLVENIAGNSRDPKWLHSLVQSVGNERLGLLGDFGNFDDDYYAGIEAMLPHCRSLCSKSWDFNEAGNDTTIDFQKMMGVINRSDFQGCLAIEYLGKNTPPVEGILKTAALIRRFAEDR